MIEWNQFVGKKQTNETYSKGRNNMAAQKCVVAKNGRVIMANDRVARKFATKTKAMAFVRNLNRVSKKTTLKSFELIAV